MDLHSLSILTILKCVKLQATHDLKYSNYNQASILKKQLASDDCFLKCSNFVAHNDVGSAIHNCR